MRELNLNENYTQEELDELGLDYTGEDYLGCQIYANNGMRYWLKPFDGIFRLMHSYELGGQITVPIPLLRELLRWANDKMEDEKMFCL